MPKETLSGWLVFLPSFLMALATVAGLILNRRDKSSESQRKDNNRRRRVDLKQARIYDDYIEIIQGAKSALSCIDENPETAKALLILVTNRQIWPDPMEELYENGNGNGHSNGNGKH